MARARSGIWLDDSVETRQGSFKDGQHDPVFPLTTHAYAITYHHRTDTPISPIPPLASYTPPLSLPVSRWLLHGDAELGFLIDFLGAAPYTVSTPFVSSSYTPNCRFPLYRHRFPQCLCIVYPLPSFSPSLCCFGSLYKSITYDNDPSHSGHSSSITNPHSHSFFPFYAHFAAPPVIPSPITPTLRAIWFMVCSAYDYCCLLPHSFHRMTHALLVLPC